MSEHRVASFVAVQAGAAVLANAGDTEVAIFLCDGKVVATQGQCPHAQGPLHEGDVDGHVLTCPWHGWSFDLLTGECLDDDSFHLTRFPARVVGDDIMVTV